MAPALTSRSTRGLFDLAKPSTAHFFPLNRADNFSIQLKATSKADTLPQVLLYNIFDILSSEFFNFTQIFEKISKKGENPLFKSVKIC
jgi:hypothetical protein